MTVHRSTDFAFGMDQVRTSAFMLDLLDWDAIIAAADAAVGFGAVLNPGLFMDIQRDKDWDKKMRLARAAQAFLREFKAVGAEVLGDAG